MWNTLKEWALANGFVPSEDGIGCVEKAYAKTDGYGYITLRLYPLGAQGCYLILSTSGRHHQAVQFGSVRSVDRLRMVHDALFLLDYEQRETD